MNIFWVLAGITMLTAIIVLVKNDSTKWYLAIAFTAAILVMPAMNLDVPIEGSAVITEVTAFRETCLLDVSLLTRGDIAFKSWSDSIAISGDDCERILSKGKSHSYNEFLEWKARS